MNASNPGTENWTFAKKTAFRLSFCFFMFQFFLGSAVYVFIFGFNFALYSWFERLYAPVYSYINSHLFHLKQASTRLTINEFLFLIIGIVTSIIVTILWTVFDKQRKSYIKADFWLSHILKYFLAIIMFSYGIDKLIPVQMSMPNTDYLYSRVGNFPPSSLFWTLMGSHTFYESFTGSVEIIAALLLLFSRTYVIGLIVLAGTLLNVLMLNISFDIGVTYFVLVLLMAVLYLLFPYLKSINYFLCNKQPGELYRPPRPNNSKLQKAIIIISIALFIVSAVLNATDSIKSYGRNIKSNEATKTFSVTNQMSGTDSLSIIPEDRDRWKFWIEYKRGGKDYVSILTMSDTVTYNLLFENDILHKVIRLKPDGRSQDTISYRFVYTSDTKTGGKTLIDSLHKIKLEITRFNSEDWDLLKRRNKLFPFDF